MADKKTETKAQPLGIGKITQKKIGITNKSIREVLAGGKTLVMETFGQVVQAEQGETQYGEYINFKCSVVEAINCATGELFGGISLILVKKAEDFLLAQFKGNEEKATLFHFELHAKETEDNVAGYEYAIVNKNSEQTDVLAKFRKNSMAAG